MSTAGGPARKTRLLKYIDHLTFPEVVRSLLQDHPDFPGVTFSAAFPDDGETFDLPKIVYTLKSRVPGLEGKETLKARLRPGSTWTNEDGTVSQLYAKWQTCLYQFDICAGSASEADQLAWKFEQLLLDSVGTFLQLGARDLIFDEQLEDALLPRVKDVVVRSLRFRAILEQVQIRTLDPVRELRIRAFLPQEEGYEAVVRGASPADGDPDTDLLEQTHISGITVVAGPQPDGIARDYPGNGTDPALYVENLDYVVLYSESTGQTALRWLKPAGKAPADGATYYVRYHFWTGFSTLYVTS